MLDVRPTQPARRIMEAHTEALDTLLRSVDISALERVVEALATTRDAGGTVFVAGNGGSAATASHLANDLCKATRSPERTPMRVLSLSDNTPWFTALANDEGFVRAFAGQLENFAGPGDVLVVISASGNSPNLVAAVDVAHAHGATAIGLLGFDGGVLRGMVDELLWLPTAPGEYALVEDAHSALCHVLTLSLCER